MITDIITWVFGAGAVALHLALFAWALRLASPESRRAVAVLGIPSLAIVLLAGACAGAIS